MPRLARAKPGPGVWHLVSEVTAETDAGNEQLLRATFPPGSVTGAPKVQAMKVIALGHEPEQLTLYHIFDRETAGDIEAGRVHLDTQTVTVQQLA